MKKFASSFPTIGGVSSLDMTANLSPIEHVNALNKVFGKHTGVRAIHAKGTVLAGIFEPSSQAREISKAAHFRHIVPVQVRFSNFSGVADMPDNHSLASPRGLAIKFALPDATTTDIVSHAFNGFPSPTAADFYELITALGDSGPDTATPTPLEHYLCAHSAAEAFLRQQKSPPVSYATLHYYGVNTFEFINANEHHTFGRYQFLPAAGEHLLSAPDAEKAEPDYLTTEIRQRVNDSPIGFKLMLQIAEPEDDLDDPSVPWPDHREVIELGTITLLGAHMNADSDDPLLFQPGALTAGIVGRDPMIQVRTHAYEVSFKRRRQT